MTHPRHDIVREHLRAYEQQGLALEAELRKVRDLRKRVTTANAVHLDFGMLNADRFSPSSEGWQRYEGHLGPILITPPTATQRDWRAPRDNCGRTTPSVGADCDIVWPGMIACLLVWLDGWAARIEADLAAWRARDALAEAVALARAEVTGG